MEITIETMVARWSDPATRPQLQRALLISEDGICCAQGDVLRMSGWADDRLLHADQREADCEVARILSISRSHAVLLRHDCYGCPEDVLIKPEHLLGDQALRILEFWRRLDRMDTDRVVAVITTDGWPPDGIDSATASSDAQLAAANASGPSASLNAACAATWPADGVVAYAAVSATHEIQGARFLESYVFLPLFGIADPSELDTPADAVLCPSA